MLIMHLINREGTAIIMRNKLANRYRYKKHNVTK